MMRNHCQKTPKMLWIDRPDKVVEHLAEPDQTTCVEVNMAAATNATNLSAKKADRENAPRKNLTGLTFGQWGVEGHAGKNARGKHIWVCVCLCGTRREVEGGYLTSGKSRSCGCGQREAVRNSGEKHQTHGKRSAPGYYVWRSLKQRCLNPKSKNYAGYGGRGITVCDRWIGSFEAFYADMGPRPSPQYSIDRVDNNGPYSADNCIWAVREAQVRNRRSNITVNYRGNEMILKDAAALSGVKYTTAKASYHRGLPDDEILA
jgi:hypothetical protein